MEKQKNSLDGLRSLVRAEPTISAAEAARRLGLSRQRISQLCKKGGISLRRAYAQRDYNPAPPAPRVITGGVPVRTNHTVTGAVSEMLVVADLMARGYKPYLPLVRQKGHDVIAVSESGDLLSFEVRSGRRYGGRISFNKTNRKVQSDHYAVVITGEPVVYEPDIG